MGDTTKDKVPAATIRGTYSTYEDSRQRSLGDMLGHVVDMRLEGLAQIECGAWMSGLKIVCPKGVRVEMRKMPDGSTKLFLKGDGK